MSDDKVSVKEALDKLYDLSWMIGSTAMEYLTDKDGEKIRDYIGVIEDRINDLEGELSEFKKYFEPYDIDEENAEAIIRSKEFGDLLWFIAEYCTAKGWSLDDIMRMNIDKLKERYPDGFKAEQSLHRKAGDI